MRVALTNQGFRFLLLLAIVGFAAYNNQNNLLYLMASVGLASVLMSIAAGWLSLSRLAFVGAEAPDAYADVPFREKLLLGSSARALSAFGVDVEDGSSAMGFLKAGERSVCHVERLYRRRGRFRGEPIGIATRFPFGFFRVRRKLAAPRDILVFPRIRPVDSSLVSSSRGVVLPQSKRRGQSDEFFRLREYVPGDHVHHIHWKTSAKLDDMMVREFGEDEQERLSLAFVRVFSNEEDTSEFEHLVSAAASLAAHLARAGVAFRFLSDDLELPPSRSSEHIRAILTYLAEVGPKRELDAAFGARMQNATSRGETVVAVALAPLQGLDRVLAPHQIFRSA